MKLGRFLFRVLLAGITFLPASVPAATQEKGGVRIDVVPKTVSRNDGTNYGYYRDIDRTLTMKATVKNTGFADLPAGTMSYTLIIRRWGMSEKASLDSESGSLELKALRKAEQAEVQFGEFSISGHMHGSSKQHLDKLDAWQVVIDFAGKKIVFESGSDFATLKAKADKE